MALLKHLIFKMQWKIIQAVKLFLARMYDLWRSGDFSIQTWRIPLEAFASKNINFNFVIKLF